MRCEELRLGLVSDDEVERAAFDAHAARCPACAAFAAADRALLREVEAWRRHPAAPRPELEARIAAALVRRRGRRLFPVLAAAALILAVVGGLWVVRTRVASPQEELAESVREVDRAERGYARAIARLERQAQGVLAEASDPALEARRAALLLAYRDRLAHLDAVIAEVESFLAENPGNAGAHTVLLSAYKEKSDVLREVVSLPPGGRS